MANRPRGKDEPYEDYKKALKLDKKLRKLYDRGFRIMEISGSIKKKDQAAS